MTSRDEAALDARIREFTESCLATLTPEQRAECDLLATVDVGMRVRPCASDMETVELLYGGAVIGRTTWAWLLAEDVSR